VVPISPSRISLPLAPSSELMRWRWGAEGSSHRMIPLHQIMRHHNAENHYLLILWIIPRTTFCNDIYTFCISLSRELRWRSRYSDGYGLESLSVGVRLPVGSWIFPSTHLRDRLWGPRNPPVHWVPGALFPGVDLFRREADQSKLKKKTWI
jgi:hypothetical protein